MSRIWLGPEMKELSSEEKLGRFELLQKIASKCPFGWHEKNIIIGRWETQESLIQWLCDIQNLCGIDEDGTVEEVLRIKGRYLSEEGRG